jgi:hypothetical protein
VKIEILARQAQNKTKQSHEPGCLNSSSM